METNRFNQIDDYLQERLTNQEERAFEEEMERDKELFRQVGLCRELKEAILEEDVNMLRAKLTLASQKAQTKNKLRALPLLLAASVAIILTTSILLWRNYTDPENLFKNNYARFEVPGMERGANIGGNNQQTKIVDLYRRGNLKSAIPLLEKYIQQNTNDKVAELMLSSAYIEYGMASKAEGILAKAVNQSKYDIYTETAQWYLCLTYLNQKKYKEAFIETSKIRASGGKYASKAEAINIRLMNHLN